MLLGCCHCPDEIHSSSSSSNPSSSSSDEESLVTGCGFCSGGVAPVRYKLVASYAPGGAACYYEYEGEYILYVRQVVTLCVWESVERAIDFSTSPTCSVKATGTGSNHLRWTIVPQTLASGVNVRANMGIWNGSAFGTATGAVGLQGSGTVRNCLLGWSGSNKVGGALMSVVVTVDP